MRLAVVTLYEVWYSAVKFFCEVNNNLTYQHKAVSRVSSTLSGQTWPVFCCFQLC